MLYAGTLKYPFQFDDYNSIFNARQAINPAIQSWLPTLHDLRQHFFLPGRQISWLTFIMNYAIHGLWLPGYHLVNIAVHGTNSFLLFLILHQLCFYAYPRGVKPKHAFDAVCLLTSLIFLCHPLAVNSVTYIIQRNGSLATMFYLAAFFLYLRLRTPTSGKPFTVSQLTGWTGFIICGWLAIHCKQMAVTLPLVCVAAEWLIVQPNAAGRRRFFQALAAVFTVALLATVMTWKMGLWQTGNLTLGFHSKLLWSPFIHFLTELRVFFWYWIYLVCPWPGWLSVQHEVSLSPGILHLPTLSALIFHLIMLAGAVYLAKKNRRLASLGIFWFYLTLGPPYLFLPQRELLVEYKVYLAIPGLAMIIADFTAQLSNPATKSPVSHCYMNRQRLAMMAAVVIILFLCWGSGKRNAVFQNEESLWTDVIIKQPASFRAYNNRAMVYCKQRKYGQAFQDYTQAIAIHPQYEVAYENRGNISFLSGHYQNALEDFSKAISLIPEEPAFRQQAALLHYKCALSLKRLGREQESQRELDKAWALNPGLQKHSQGR